MFFPRIVNGGENEFRIKECAAAGVDTQDDGGRGHFDLVKKGKHL